MIVIFFTVHNDQSVFDSTQTHRVGFRPIVTWVVVKYDHVAAVG